MELAIISTSFRIQKRAGCGKVQNNMGGHCTKNNNIYLEEGWDTVHTFLIGEQLVWEKTYNCRGTLYTLCCQGNIWVGDTAQHWKNKTPIKFQLSSQSNNHMVGRVAGLVVGRVVLSENITTLWLHLTSWNLPDSQLNWEFKMGPKCGNIAWVCSRKKFGRLEKELEKYPQICWFKWRNVEEMFQMITNVDCHS